MKPICLYFDLDTLSEDVMTYLFWNFISEKICFKIQIEESYKLLIGNSKKEKKKYFINIIESDSVQVIIDGTDLISNELVSDFSNFPVTISTQFLKVSNDFLSGKVQKDIGDDQSTLDTISQNINLFKSPWLDYICNIIHQKINQEQKSFEIAYLKVNYWNSDKNFAVALSHDVDHIKLRKTFLLSNAKFWLKKKVILPFGFYFKGISHLIGLSDNVNNFERYLKIEKKFNVSSTFFFLHNTAKELNDDLIKIIPNYDVEIGLHGDFNTCNNLKKLTEEKNIVADRFNIDITGIRQHYLEFEPENTWYIHQKCGLIYDSTFGFSKRAGFRAGTCFPYIPLENFVEITLILMDTLWVNSKLISKPKDWKKYIFSLIDQIKEFNGLLTVNWHNSNLQVPFNYFYKDIIKYL